MLTFQDLVNHVYAYLGKDVRSTPDAKRAVLAAYRDIGNMREWTYYHRNYRFVTNPRYATGTIAYDHTGGAYERLLTLSSGTWPTWAAYGQVVISDVKYDVASYIDSTRIQLAEQSNPGADVAAGTSYSIERDTYPLPTDFRSLKLASWADGQLFPIFVEPGEWSAMTAYRTSVGRPMWYTIYADRNYFGTMGIRFWPAPDDDYPVDLLYLGRGRNLQIEKYSTGTATASSGATTVTGSGTSWTSRMIGSTIRLGESTTQEPTNYDGMYPYIDERVITAVASATSLTIDAATTQAFTAVKYAISDPVDVEAGSMESLLLREIEKHCRSIYRMKATNEEPREYEMAKILAYEADSRFSGPRKAGYYSGGRRRLQDMPIDFGM